jgi:hypothetical protein
LATFEQIVVRSGPAATLGVSGRKGVLPPKSTAPAGTSSITTARPPQRRPRARPCSWPRRRSGTRPRAAAPVVV